MWRVLPGMRPNTSPHIFRRVPGTRTLRSANPRRAEFPQATGLQSIHEESVSRPAEELLEFDRLKEIVGGETTCAPGRRAIHGLAPHQDVAALEADFRLLQEAVAYLRAGSEIGFGTLADPEPWLARVAVPGAVLSPAELIDVISLAEATSGAKQTFRSEAARYPLLSERAASLSEFRPLSQAIRRAVLPNGEISDEGSPQLKRIRANVLQAREKIKRSL